MRTEEAIIFAFEAKKWGQAHTGVGDKTDMLVFQKNKPVMKIYDDSQIMRRMDDEYEKEIERRKEIRKKLTRELFEDSRGNKK
jgi:hypothetical protein